MFSWRLGRYVLGFVIALAITLGYAYALFSFIAAYIPREHWPFAIVLGLIANALAPVTLMRLVEKH